MKLKTYGRKGLMLRMMTFKKGYLMMKPIQKSLSSFF